MNHMGRTNNLATSPGRTPRFLLSCGLVINASSGEAMIELSAQERIVRRTSTLIIVLVIIVSLAIGVMVGSMAGGTHADPALAWTPAASTIVATPPAPTAPAVVPTTTPTT